MKHRAKLLRTATAAGLAVAVSLAAGQASAQISGLVPTGDRPQKRRSLNTIATSSKRDTYQSPQGL